MTDTRIEARQPGPFREAIATQVRVLSALILREARTRFGRSRLGYLWAIGEPVVYVMTFTAAFTLLRTLPALGNSIAEFLLTGILPYQVFSNIVQRASTAIPANRALLTFPIVKNMDTIMARIALEIATSLLAFLILFGLLGFVGVTRMPDDLLGFLAGIGALMLLGTGIGVVAAVGTVVNSTVATVFPWVMRFTFFISGPFFILDQLSNELADKIAWNPVVHGIEWVRTAYFPVYASSHLDRGYILFIGLATLALGLALERMARKHLALE